MEIKHIVEIIAAAMLPLGLVILMSVRLYLQKSSIGARVVQFITVIMLIPTILILALEGILDDTTVGTLLGGFAGYVLSGLSNFDSAPNKSSASGDSG